MEELFVRANGFINLDRANTELKWVTTSDFQHATTIPWEDKKLRKERDKAKWRKEQNRIPREVLDFYIPPKREILVILV